MNKIDKLDKELEKARRRPLSGRPKSGSWKSRNRRKKTARSCGRCALKLTPAELMAFLNGPKNSLAASGHNGPKPEAPEKEDTAHEEN